MSVINSAAHNVVSYISGTTKPFAGQRLSTITYKTVTDKNSPLCNVKRESKAVSLPVIGEDEIAANIGALIPHIRTMLQKAQDAIIRERLDAGNVSLITADEISMAAVCEYLDNSNESGRLTKETVAAWFDSSIADMLTVTLADKLGVSDTPDAEETAKLAAIVSGFRDKVSALAGGKTSYEPKLCESLKKCLALADNGDVMAVRFTQRLDKMIVEGSKNAGLMDLL